MLLICNLEKSRRSMKQGTTTLLPWAGCGPRDFPMRLVPSLHRMFTKTANVALN